MVREAVVDDDGIDVLRRQPLFEHLVEAQERGIALEVQIVEKLRATASVRINVVAMVERNEGVGGGRRGGDFARPVVGFETGLVEGIQASHRRVAESADAPARERSRKL